MKEKLYLEIDSGANKEEFIEVENALQSAIMMGNEAIAKSHPDYVPLYVANAVLGGYFGSRLMNNIREEKGYSYGIGSYLISNKHLNYLLITTEVGVKHTASAVEEIKKEIERLQNELVGENELRRVKNYLKGKLLRMFDGVFPSMDRFLSARVLGIEYAFLFKAYS